MKIGFVSLGCAKNLVDSEMVMGLLLANDHQLVTDAAKAEVIIINTCGFINSAKEESINTILEMAEYKKQNCRFLIVMGCLAQRYLSDLEQALPEVDRFITIDEYARLSEIFAELFQLKFTSYGKNKRVISTKPWTAYLKIAEGCSNRCSYCAIPLIRGDYHSIAINELLAEAQDLADSGVKELVVIAQDTTRYGSDIDGKYHLLSLLTQLNKIEGLHWIRVLYMYPDEISDELVLGMQKLEKVLPYFDIPVQHGTDQMLLAMNRRGTIESIKHTIDLIRNTYEQAVLRTTIIVGFPNETNDDFKQLLEFVKATKWDRLGAFTYSHEEDTPAYQLIDNISEETKQKRLDELMMIQQAIAIENSKKLLGCKLEVLIESYDMIKKHYRGRSLFSAPDGVDGTVFVTSDIEMVAGNFYQVMIDKSEIHDLYGHLIETDA